MRALRLSISIASLITACSGCYHLPVWKGDVHVTPLERKAVETCGAGGVTPEGQKRITREPYMQSTTKTSTVVAWGSTDGRGDLVIQEPGGEVIKTQKAIYVGDADREARRKAAQGKPNELAADDIYVIAAQAAGLKANHLYCYHIEIDGQALTQSAPMSTATPPGLSEPLRFVAVGDTGTGGDAQHAIMERMTESPFDFLLFLGDIAYENGTAAQMQGHFFSVYQKILRYVPVFPTLGNHERVTRKGRPYLEAFVLPEPERYYSFDWGDVHFVCIDTTQRDAEQLTWLDDDLGRNKLPWVIVFGHHPMYTNSLRGPQLWIRQAFAKIITDHHVDLVLTGHEHQYERFRINGVNYIVSGGGGGQLTHFFGANRSLKQATRHHYLAFEVTKDSLTMKAIDISGKEIETLKLSKEGDKVKVNGKPDTRQNPVAPEPTTKPDEKLHDEPDDDKNRVKVMSPTDEPVPVEVPQKSAHATPPVKVAPPPPVPAPEQK